MSSFVDIFGFEPPEEAGVDEPEEYVKPAWLGPPEGELGVCVPLSRVVGRSETAVVALRQATAYSSGVTLDFLAVARGIPGRRTDKLFNEQHFADPEDLSDRFLRIGIEFSDGARVSNLASQHRFWRPEREPEGPLLLQSGGGGGFSGRGRVEMNPAYWLWPLPAAGTLRLFVEWPALGIALTGTDVDGAAIVRAAAESQQLWTY